MTATGFSYSEAFSRNIGWTTQDRQMRLRHKRIAIAGMGGVGGTHLLTLPRLRIGAFNIADFDTFDVANINRQVGANVSTVCLPKVDVRKKWHVTSIRNSTLEFFRTATNLPQFLDGVDLYVDGLDFFAFSARQAPFAACADLRIPANTATLWEWVPHF